jgi:hypothetical protein
MLAVLHREVNLGPIGPTPSSLLTQMSSTKVDILRGAILLSPCTGAKLKGQ